MPITAPESVLAERTAPPGEPIPFYLESRGEPLFAWLHPGRPGVRHGVVLCPPVGHEQVHSHRGWRHLAEAVARAGFPVLRFDYHGTGDSAGTDEDPDRVATWRQNVRDAIGRMGQQLGCGQVSLIGLRLGAALAALAAAAEPVDQLVLWAPVVSGRKYVRELRALSAAGPGGPTLLPPGDFEAAGFAVTARTAADLQAIDLLAVRPRCRRALIVTRDDLPDDGRLRAHLEALGIPAEQVVQSGYADMMAEPHYTRVPRSAIDTIADWMESGGVAGDPAPPDPDLPTSAVIRADGPPVRERPCAVGGDPRLFGVATEPAAGTAADLPWVVLLNAGAAYRVGPNRLNVQLARALAARGFPCLRLDFGGLGDSPAADPARENDAYPATGFADIDRAIRHLQAVRGAGRVVLLGLCSGAYFAFQAAAQMADPALVESVVINPLTFFWREGMSLDAPEAKRLTELHYFLTAATRPGNWLKVLFGRSKIGLGGAARVLAERWRLGRQSAGPAERDPGTGVAPAHRESPDVAGDLGRMVRRGRRLTFAFARTDPGPWILRVSAKRALARACRAGHVRVITIDGADHTFAGRAPRQQLVNALSEHLASRYLPSAPESP